MTVQLKHINITVRDWLAGERRQAYRGGPPVCCYCDSPLPIALLDMGPVFLTLCHDCYYKYVPMDLWLDFSTPNQSIFHPHIRDLMLQPPETGLDYERSQQIGYNYWRHLPFIKYVSIMPHPMLGG